MSLVEVAGKKSCAKDLKLMINGEEWLMASIRRNRFGTVTVLPHLLRLQQVPSFYINLERNCSVVLVGESIQESGTPGKLGTGQSVPVLIVVPVAVVPSFGPSEIDKQDP